MGTIYEASDRTKLTVSKHLSYSSCSINSSKTSGIVLDSESEAEYNKFNGELSFSVSKIADSEKDDIGKSTSILALTNKQKIIVIGMLCANLCMGANYSLLGPFFPHQAEKKGFTPTQYCLVFGVFQLATFLVSPLIGRFMPPLTPKFCLIAGAFLNGSCAVLFGLLQWCPGNYEFLIVAFTIEIVQAIGCAAVFTSSYTVVSTEFSDRAPLFFSSVEASYGAGQAVGPIIGGHLHEKGGFFLPYTVMGSVTILMSGMLFFFPRGKSEEFASDYTTTRQRESTLETILNFSFLINLMVVVLVFMLMCFLDATLEPHLRQFHLPPRIIGLVFPITGAFYALSAPVWGLLSGKLNDPRKVSLIGCGLCAVAFLLLGPQPFIPLKTKLWLVILGQFCLGSGAGAGMVGSFAHSIKQRISSNMNAPDVSTYAVISGATSSAVALGSFIGPSVGGPIVESMGFPGGTLILLGIIACLTVILTTHMAFNSQSTNEQEVKKECQKHFLESIIFAPSKGINLITRSCEWPRSFYKPPLAWQHTSV